MSYLTGSERRTSTRVQTRLYVRGLGGSGRLVEELGDYSLGGVGFSAIEMPRIERFRVAFATPSDERLKSATCEVIGATPLDAGFHLHLKFLDLDFIRREAFERLQIERPKVPVVPRSTSKVVASAPSVWLSRKDIPLVGTPKEEGSRLNQWIWKLLRGGSKQVEAESYVRSWRNWSRN